MPALPKPPMAEKAAFFDDDDEGWQDMPVIRDDFANGLDEEDKKKYHYVTPASKETAQAGIGNATGNLIDFDVKGQEWREKQDANESEYTRLRLDEENDNDEVLLRTKYLFDEDKAMTPLSQMQATKDMLTEAQRIAYVGLCALAMREMTANYKLVKGKELKAALESHQLWALKIMGRLYYHMELETAEQKMIESLAEHGVEAADLVPSLMTTHTVSNPEYDPAAARRQEQLHIEEENERLREEEEHSSDITEDSEENVLPVQLPAPSDVPLPKTPNLQQTTANVLPQSGNSTMAGVSTSLSTTEKDVTLDIRWTVLCDLFLIIVADSVYDARSRVLLESIAFKMGLGWTDITKFEQRVTEALEIQEGVERLEQKDIIDGRTKSSKKRRYAMLGLATLGGGLVIGLSAGLLAPVIGAGLGAAFATIGVTGTSGFLAGAGGAAVITTAGTLTGSGIAMRGMARRTREVRTFDLLPLHNNKRVNCILTVSGFMTSAKDDVRLPFSVLDPVVGDVFSALWEPEMLGETGNTLKILTSEVLSQVGQTVLSATVMTALMSALQWPILLTKLGYLIDNPWSNALDRARAAGGVLADVLIQRHLGVRPITLIGFSLGARVIFYCLLELARHKAFGIVQDVFIFGATLTASTSQWLQARSVVAGRFVNGYAKNDWVLNYLFRATSGGLNSIAGLRPVTGVVGLENVDVTDKITGHMSYRAFMPLILDQIGFPVFADHFDELEDPDMDVDRMIIREEEEQVKKKGWFSRKSKSKPKTPPKPASRPPSTLSLPKGKRLSSETDSDLPERMDLPASPIQSPPTTPGPEDSVSSLPKHAGFDFKAIHEVIQNEGGGDLGNSMHAPIPQKLDLPPPYPLSSRSVSVPLPAAPERDRSVTPTKKQLRFSDEYDNDVVSSSVADSNSRRDFVSRFSRSFSFDDSSIPEAEAEKDPFDDEGAVGFNDKSYLSARPSAPANERPVDATVGSSSSGYRAGSWDPESAEDDLSVTSDPFVERDVGTRTPKGPPPNYPYGMYAGSSSSSSSSSSARVRPAAESTISFGGADGSVWCTRDVSVTSRLGNNTSSSGGGTLSFGFGDSSEPGHISLVSPRLPPPPDNPFASSSLSFAGPGGSPMLSTSDTTSTRESASDFWSPPPLPGLGTKKRSDTASTSTSVISSNPWG